MNAVVGNWKTSLLGFLLGTLTYAQSVGGKFPTSKQEWMAFGVSAALAGLGIAAKGMIRVGGRSWRNEAFRGLIFLSSGQKWQKS